MLELDDWFAREELLWRQRSRIEWLKEGDSNTKFFHTRASQRRKKNHVSKIKVASNKWISDEVDICKEALIHFARIYRSVNRSEAMDWEERMDFVQSSVSADKVEWLCTPFIEADIQSAVFQLGATKAPGPDGYSALFYHEFWNLVKEDVIQASLNFLNGGGTLERGMNDTLIALVPKTKSPETFDELRPISLCNVAMKIITKALANRLKGVLNECIFESQSAFVPSRLITDNILIAHELISYMRTRPKGGVGYCCIKLDMSKAYDRVEWDLLEEMQRRMGFPDLWINKREGLAVDPLSPYLFVICTEWLAQRLKTYQQVGDLQGIKVGKSGPVISHFLFADDCILFVKADVDNVLKLKKVLREYEAVSGQQINYGKSEMFVGDNVSMERARCFGGILGVRVVECIDKYLGLPVSLNGRKTALLNFIEDRMWKRVNGWKEKLLSVAGKEILIKSVVQAIPIYALSCFKMPKRIFLWLGKGDFFLLVERCEGR
ncbi:hypothetical protein QQ045_025635 [Rhodiola kirilowii]